MMLITPIHFRAYFQILLQEIYPVIFIQAPVNLAIQKIYVDRRKLVYKYV